jgi:isopenicillin-N epimerase
MSAALVIILARLPEPPAMQPSPAQLRAHWTLDPAIAFLNHGSFGACPRPVLAEQDRLRACLEREPVQFLVHELEPLLDEARREVAAFVGADPDDLAFVRNATSGVSAVLLSLDLRPGDELLTTDQSYNACRNALDHAAARTGARVVTVRAPFPVSGPDEIEQAILDEVSPHTRLALLDHVTSPTGLILPIAALVERLGERGVDTLVDGAHAPGMLPLDVAAIGAAYYTGNFHKWVCAPKGAAMLHVRRDRQAGLHPAVVSHGYNSRRPRSRFLEEFDWTGTDDPTPWLCVPAALRFMGGLLPGGWDEVRARNRDLALAARRLLCDALAASPPAPDEMIGSLASVPLPDGAAGPVSSAVPVDPLQAALYERHRIEVPVAPWPAPPGRVIRISAQLYNDIGQYERLAAALREELGGSARPARASRGGPGPCR